MKKTLISILSCLISLIITNNNIILTPNSKIIVIDPGHGGYDGGTIVDNILEKNLNLEISLTLRNILNENGYDVVLTRDKDIDLSNGEAFIKKEDMINRMNIINNSNGLLAVSIHMNYFTNSSYYGPQVFYSSFNNENKKLAYNIQTSLKCYLDTSRTIYERNNVYLLKHSIIPICLIECGFLSNINERELLLDPIYQYKLAYSIYYGIDGYLR